MIRPWGWSQSRQEVAESRTATSQHEDDFNQQQALQVQLSAQSIEDHFEWLQGDLTTLATYAFPYYLYNGSSADATVAMFEAYAHIVYPDEELMIAYFSGPSTVYASYTHPDAPLPQTK